MKKLTMFVIVFLFVGINSYAAQGDLVVNGTLNVGTGGVKFTDGSTQTTAKWPTTLATNGYTKLPNGMILQWGEFVMGTGWYNQLFVIPFPTACLNVQVTAKAPTDTYAEAAQFPPTLRVKSKTGFQTGIYQNGGSGWRMSWSAIGYLLSARTS